MFPARSNRKMRRLFAFLSAPSEKTWIEWKALARSYSRRANPALALKSK